MMAYRALVFITQHFGHDNFPLSSGPSLCLPSRNVEWLFRMQYICKKIVNSVYVGTIVCTYIVDLQIARLFYAWSALI